MTVLVTGATGAVGPTIVQALISAGHRVRVLTRRSVPPLDSTAPVESAIGDLLDPASLLAATTGIDTIVHLAGLLHLVDPAAVAQADYNRVNVDGTRAVIDAARRHGARRLILASTIAVYGDTHGVVATEETMVAPASRYAESKLEAERHVLAARRADGAPLGTVFRLGAVYGARMKGNYRQLVLALARGRFVPIGRGDNRRSLIHDRDVARAVTLAIEHPAAAGRIFNLTDGQPHPLRAIVAAICQALDRRPPAWTLPVPIARAAAAAAERLAPLVRRPAPLTRVMIDKYLEDAAVDSSRVRRDLGFAPGVDLASGWRDAVEGLRRTGDLPARPVAGGVPPGSTHAAPR
jgi:UDP-glucose 4-epimerase